MKEALFDVLFSLLLQMPSSPLDQMPESFDDYIDRMENIAAGIERVANRAACYGQSSPCRPIIGSRYTAASVLMVQANRESAFRRDVQHGMCRVYECDHGRAKGPFQLQRAPTETVEQWESYAGDNIVPGAWRTLVLWADGARKPKGIELHCGFARLAGYGICWNDYGKDRAAEVVRVEAKIREGMRKAREASKRATG